MARRLELISGVIAGITIIVYIVLAPEWGEPQTLGPYCDCQALWQVGWDEVNHALVGWRLTFCAGLILSAYLHSRYRVFFGVYFLWFAALLLSVLSIQAIQAASTIQIGLPAFWRYQPMFIAVVTVLTIVSALAGSLGPGMERGNAGGRLV